MKCHGILRRKDPGVGVLHDETSSAPLLGHFQSRKQMHTNIKEMFFSREDMMRLVSRI